MPELPDGDFLDFMELRTTFNIVPSSAKITYKDPALFIGSCFSASIGEKFEAGHMPVMVNPSGTVYNPVSVINTLDIITSKIEYTINDLYNHNGRWVSFNHYCDFSSDVPETVLKRINDKSDMARKFIQNARFLFITFGTARVYRWKKSGKIVSNCHKIPSEEFIHELLTVDDIVAGWTKQLDNLSALYPELRVVFTVSPVRHWKDGAHGNQVSKSVLFLAVEELLHHSSVTGYFPAYEILMDDLRDYRFYADDMLHPSQLAKEYIWETFSQCYLDDDTRAIWNEVNKITRATSHRFLTDSDAGKKRFAEKNLSLIDSVLSRIPSIELNTERRYFLDLLGT
jgi:hypothetical protein